MRTPEDIIGADAVLELGLAGYEIVPMQAVTKAVKRLGAREFANWWNAYPAKVGKGAAEKAYTKARTLADADVLLAGVQRYAVKRDDRPWCNPATWLNQQRWLDEEPAPMQPPPARGIAGVRQRLEREVDHGRYGAPPTDRGFGDHADRGLPSPDQRR